MPKKDGKKEPHLYVAISTKVGHKYRIANAACSALNYMFAQNQVSVYKDRIPASQHKALQKISTEIQKSSTSSNNLLYLINSLNSISAAEH